jgi:prepilin-type N-terminal cleavage/methylation domain-containing protein
VGYIRPATSSRSNDARTRRSSAPGFTLIELLVVVAIIALLISILLPSLARARSQARTTLCNSRITQVTKSMFLYADDFAETPPFIDHAYDTPDPNESWLASPNDMIIVLNHTLTENDWNAMGVRLPEGGSLFSYTRFPQVYRCPEFERITDAGIMHHRFNSTRSIGGKRYRSSTLMGGPAINPIGDFRGPTMKLSNVYSPSALFMMVDERWDRHVAGDYQYDPNPDKDTPMRADPVLTLQDELGQYHGTPTKEREEYIGLCKSASTTFWDGHVELHRDPSPTPDNRKIRFPDVTYLFSHLDEARPFLWYMSNQVFAQQGFDMSPFLAFFFP